MKKYVFCFVAILIIVGCNSIPIKTLHRSDDKVSTDTETDVKSGEGDSQEQAEELGAYCKKELAKLPAGHDPKLLQAACAKVRKKDVCNSNDGKPIFHYDKKGISKNSQNILVISLIHGDEYQSGSVARLWMERLETIDSRNSWRILPIANPDGLARKTRTNARGVDINRNFPSEDWDELALKLWAERYKKNKRRNPGQSAASEVETQCLIQHIQEFKPSFIISIHTPLAVLDFDGPKINYPKFGHLPWVKVGTFPGSLGRYMWVDHEVPVLTVELKPGNKSLLSLNDFENLQDISGLIAILANRKLKQK